MKAMWAARVILAVAAITASCATESPPPKQQPAKAKPERDGEAIATEAERKLNAAEVALRDKKPDEARDQLDAAGRELEDPKVDTYPEAKQLRARHLELLKKVPEVREEVRKEALAAEVAATKAKIEEARARMKSEKDPKAAGEAADAVRAALDGAGDLESKDLEFSKYSLGVRKELSTQRAAIEKRKLDLELAAQRMLVNDAAAAAKKAMLVLASMEDIKAAEAAIGEMEKAIEVGEPYRAKDAGYSKFAAEARKSAGAFRIRILEKSEDLSAAAQKAEVQAALGNMTRAMAEANWDAAAAAVEEVKAALAKGEKMEHESAQYNAFAIGAHKKLKAAEQKLGSQKKELAFQQGPLAAVNEAYTLLAGAESEAMDVRAKSYASALEKLTACRKDAAGLLADSPKLATMSVVVGKKKMRASELLRICADNAKTTEAKLAGMKTTLAFYEGPAASSGKAKAALELAVAATDAEAKKKAMQDALANYETCIETGRILAHQHPELNKKPFELKGEKVTLVAIVLDCNLQAKALRDQLAGPAAAPAATPAATTAPAAVPPAKTSTKS